MELQPEPQSPLSWLLVIETLIPNVRIGPAVPLLPEAEDAELGWTTTDQDEQGTW